MSKSVLAGLAVAATASAVCASTVTLDFGPGSSHDPLPGSGGSGISERGGAFFVSGALGNFTSFCLELDEGIRETAYDFTIDDAVRSGGVGGGSPDPLSAETAELYRQYVSGAIGPMGGMSQTDFNNAFQDAIWYLEEELGGVDFGATTAEASSDNFVNLTATTQDLINSVWDTTKGVGLVRALNLRDVDTGADAQSILYITVIPLPGAGALAMTGLFGVAAVRRRRMS